MSVLFRYQQISLYESVIFRNVLVRRQPSTAETRVRTQDSPCGLYGGQCNSERFLPEYFRCALSIIRLMLHNYFNLNAGLISRTRERGLENFRKSKALSLSAEYYTEK